MASARSLGSLTVDLIAKVGGWTAGLDQAERKAKQTSSNITKSFEGLKETVASALEFAGLAVSIEKIAEETIAAEKAFALLDNAVKATGGSAGFTTQALVEYADELQKVSIYDDKAIQGAEQLLLRFKSIQGANFKRATADILDLATAMGTDLNAAALLVGKALEDPEKGAVRLAKANVVLSASQKELIKNLAESGDKAGAQALILQALEDSYKGAAAAARNTFGGALAGLKNSFDHLLEGETGDAGVSSFTKAINDLADLLSSTEVKNSASQFINGLFQIVSVATNAAIAISKLSKEINDLVPASKDFSSEVNRLLGISAEGFARIAGGFTPIDQIKKDIGDLDAALNNSFMGRPLKYINTNREDLEKMRAELEAQLKLLTSPPPKAAPSGGLPADEHSEAYTKLAESLEEQIALYGKTGQAAKIAYEIQSGQLDNLSKQEQQHVLSLAKQLDALDAIKKAIKNDPALADVTLAADVKPVGDTSWYKKYYDDLDERTKTSYEKQHDAVIQLEQDLEELRATGQYTAEDLHDRYIEAFDKLVPDVEVTAKKVGKALEKPADELSEYMKEAARNTQDIIANALDDGFKGGIKGIIKSFGEMLKRLADQAVAADLSEKLFGKDAGGSGTGGGLIGSLIDWGSKLFGSTGARASGGSVASSSLYRVNEAGRMEAYSIPGGADYLLTGSRSGQVVPASRASGGSSVTQNIVVQGRVDQRSAKQLQIEAAKQQRMAVARLA